MNGLILIGGRGSRLGGVDKSMLWFNNQPQRVVLHELLRNFCKNVYFSCRYDQLTDMQHPYIVDTHEQGPLGGMLSAFEAYPTAAWLVVACDMPNLNQLVLNRLVQGRDISKHATVYFNEVAQAIEPLVGIYEPSVRPIMQYVFDQQMRSPKKVLEQLDVQLIRSSDADFFKNVNVIEDFPRKN